MLLHLAVVLALLGCESSYSSATSEVQSSTSAGSAPIFRLLSPAECGIAFENALPENDQLNILSYEYFYNGGGVAIGDINGDGLPDVVFTANLVANRLYLN